MTDRLYTGCIGLRHISTRPVTGTSPCFKSPAEVTLGDQLQGIIPCSIHMEGLMEAFFHPTALIPILCETEIITTISKINNPALK